MCFDIDGNLYVAVPVKGQIAVFDARGSELTRMEVGGRFPTNLAFSIRDPRNLVVTEAATGQLLLFRSWSDGLPLLMDL